MDDSQASEQPQQQGQSGQQAASTEETLRGTFLGIVHDLRNIVRGEAELARAELKEDANRIGKGAGMIAGSGVLSYTGFL
ncbi:MAG TPA: phage holin family protein, partial [Thermomicrobiales bacterium]|nr:phage holin family protein [Thermomicrobiales bacterium]